MVPVLLLGSSRLFIVSLSEGDRDVLALLCSVYFLTQMVYIYKPTKVQRTHGTSDGNGDYCKVRFMRLLLDF